MERLCPDCHQPLTPRVYHTVSLDICPRCEAVWFDGAEIDSLRSVPGALLEIEHDLAPAITHKPQVNTDRWCPTCPQPLQRFTYAAGGGVTVDGCPHCQGIWVTVEALDRMREWVAQHTLERSLRPHNSADDAALAIAQFTQEHEQFMARAHALSTFFRLIDWRSGRYGGWW